MHHYQHSLAWICTSMQKISLFDPFIFWNTVNFTRPDWQHPVFDQTQRKTFDQLLVFVNLYHHAKSVAVSSICSGEIVHLKILQSDWLRASWPIFQKQNFSQIWDLCRNTANNVRFFYKTNSVKTNDQIFSWISNPPYLVYFQSISLIVGAKEIFPKYLAVTNNFIRVFSTMQKLKKS